MSILLNWVLGVSNRFHWTIPGSKSCLNYSVHCCALSMSLHCSFMNVLKLLDLLGLIVHIAHGRKVVTIMLHTICDRFRQGVVKFVHQIKWP